MAEGDIRPLAPEQVSNYRFGRTTNPYAELYNARLPQIVGKGAHTIEVTEDTKSQHVAAIYQAARKCGAKAYIKAHKDNPNALVVSVVKDESR